MKNLKMFILFSLTILLFVTPLASASDYLGDWGKVSVRDGNIAKDLNVVKRVPYESKIVEQRGFEEIGTLIFALVFILLGSLYINSVLIDHRFKLFYAITLSITALVILIPASYATFQVNYGGVNAVEKIGYNYVVFSWETPTTPTMGELNIGPTDTMGMIKQTSGYQNSQLINVTGLNPDTKYYYQLNISNSSGDYHFVSDHLPTAVLTYYPFIVTTAEEPDTEPPNITTDVKIIKRSTTSAEILWNTDEDSDSKVYYSEDLGFNSLEAVSGLRKSHSVTLTNLVEGTVYNIKANSCDDEGNCVNSSVLQFIADDDTQQQFIETDLKDYNNAWGISFSGETKPFSEVKIWVNNQAQVRVTADMEGNFIVRSLPLSQSTNPNVIKLESTDQSGNKVTKEYSLQPDLVRPELNITDWNETSLNEHMTIKGTVDERVNVTITVMQRSDVVAPNKVENLNATSVMANSVELEWDENTESDLHQYLVYRNGVLIHKTTNTHYQDFGIDAGTQYNYTVSAMDDSCNEGPKSDKEEITTDSSGQVYNIAPVEISPECSKFLYENTFYAYGPFSTTISLSPGINKLSIIAEDKAGNIDTFEENIYFDSGDPEFIETNLEKYKGVTYEKTIKINGNISEEATVYVYLNGHGSYHQKVQTTPTSDPNKHSFEIPVTLERDVDLAVNAQTYQQQIGSVEFQSGSAWTNTIVLVAEDSAGRNVSYSPVEIVYTLCSVGSWYRVDKSPIQPDVLTPRLIIEGMQRIGMGVNLTWQGSTDYNATIRDVRLNRQTINLEEEDDWDFDWVDTQSMNALYGGNQAWIELRIKAIDPSDGADWTWYEKEANISSHRNDGQCITVPKGVGCFRMPLILEIEFEIPGESTPFVQKECWDLEVAIDERLNPDLLPESFLKKTADMMDDLVESIDTLLDPVKQLEQVMIIASFSSMAWMYIQALDKRFTCDGSEFLSKFSGSSWDKDAASYGYEGCKKAGYCPAQQTSTGSDPKTKDEQLCNLCTKCGNATQKYEESKRLMYSLSGRVFCPTAPTLKKYVSDQTEKTVADIQSGNDINAVTDCQLNKGIGSDPGYYYNTQKVAGSALNDYYVYNKNNKNKCESLHWPDERCCANEYMQKYGYACGIGEVNMFDELQESACLEAEARDDSQLLDELKCNVVYNSVAGFCDPDGTEPAQYISAEKNIEFITSKLKNEDLFIKVVDPKNSDDGLWIIEPGTVRKSIASLGTEGEKHKEGEPSDIIQKNQFHPIDGKSLTAAFVTRNEKENFEFQDYEKVCGKKDVSSDTGEFGRIMGTLVNAQPSQMRDLCKRVYNEIGAGNDQVVDPTSGLLRSAQCVCIPAFKSYLSFYRAMAEAVGNCFKTILATGDGSSGMCQAVLSVYVCDLIWDLIRCFKQKFSYSPRGSKQGDIKNFFANIVGAGEDVGNAVNDMYGDTDPWRAMFSEKKLVHGLCLWAFTGTWDMDVQSFFDSNFSVPIESQGMLYPCTRRFVSFDPTSSPRGKVTYQYHIGAGLVAGANLSNVHIKYVCSNDVSCDPYHGYENGRCDCFGGAEQTGTVGWAGIPPQMLPGEVLSEDIYEERSGYRYDKAVLSWTYKKNGQTITDTAECKIKQAGGDPPAYCEWSFAHTMFLCDMGGSDDCPTEITSTPEVKAGHNYKDAELVFDDVEIIHENSDGDSRTYNRCTKWLIVEVSNKKTGIIVESDPVLINYDDQREFEVNLGKIEGSWFEMSSGVRLNNKDSNDVIDRTGKLTKEGVYKVKLNNDNTASCYSYGSLGDCGTNSGPTSVSATTTSSSNKVSCGGNEFFIKSDKIGTESGCLELKKDTNTEEHGCGKDPLEDFTATFTLYDAKQSGSGYVINRQSVTQWDGDDQVKEIEFKLYCDAQAGEGATSTSLKVNTLNVGGSSDDVVLVKGAKYKVDYSFSSSVSDVKIVCESPGKDDVEYSLDSSGDEIYFGMEEGVYECFLKGMVSGKEEEFDTSEDKTIVVRIFELGSGECVGTSGSYKEQKGECKTDCVMGETEMPSGQFLNCDASKKCCYS